MISLVDHHESFYRSAPRLGILPLSALFALSRREGLAGPSAPASGALVSWIIEEVWYHPFFMRSEP